MKNESISVSVTRSGSLLSSYMIYMPEDGFHLDAFVVHGCAEGVTLEAIKK